ncbi:MAG: helix-turn-helix transcriptional regulator [Lachnospiraceae bacterium]|nr:helix-turn-helix transcriptional regulator [Lachnospiraceae bacterium]
MTIRNALNQKHMSVYQLAKASRLPYATVNDICNGKARLEKCSGETIYRLAQALDVSMEELLAPCLSAEQS